MDTESTVQIENSTFLQFIFNRLASIRKILYQAGASDKVGVNSVVSESIRTIRTLFTHADINMDLRDIFNDSFIFSLENLDIEEASESDIDALMSMIQEASFQRVAIGQPCINKQGKIFTVLGVFSNEMMNNNKHHEIPIFPNSMPDELDCMSLAGLYFDPQNPER